MGKKLLSCNEISMCIHFQSAQKWALILYFFESVRNNKYIDEVLSMAKGGNGIFFHNRSLCKDMTLTA